ncbi:MAG: hypothetical protein IJ366_10415 [Clostridia bacterium]|nr:hypothetical protein [Clostridia bacterium]
MQYDKIISLPHPDLKNHYPMSLHNRAAQFAPFAALTGYDDACKEVTRLTDSRIELDDDRVAELDVKTQILIDHTGERPEIEIEYFVPDKRKSGGAYYKIKGFFRWYDSGNASIVLSDGMSIAISDIYRIDGDIFGIYL